jgi:hypothetical protein
LRAVDVLNLRELTTGVIGYRAYVRGSLGWTAQGIGEIIDAPTRGVGEVRQKVVIVVVKTERVDGVPHPKRLARKIVVLVVPIIDDARAVRDLDDVAVGIVTRRDIGRSPRIIAEDLAIASIVDVVGHPRATGLTGDHVTQGITAIARHTHLRVFHRREIEAFVIDELTRITVDETVARVFLPLVNTREVIEQIVG